MLKSLFGSKDKEMILQYLLLAENGYASEIAKFWDVNVPQINKMLIALKESGILQCKAFGKTLVYNFNSNCSFIEELKMLLQKAKKSYDRQMLLKLQQLANHVQCKDDKQNRKKSGYYSGPIALNLFPDDDNGDWHSAIATHALATGVSKSPYFIMGRQKKLSTKKYLKDEGIVDISDTVKYMKNHFGITKAARPYRAVADMVIVSLLNGKATDHIEYNDWLVTDDERSNFKRLLEHSMSRMNFAEKERIDSWVKSHL